jgi:hypothetical protein
MAYAISSTGTDFIFGIHCGHLNDQAHRIATTYGCTLVRTMDPTGARYGLFCMPDRGPTYNEYTRTAVLKAIRIHGGFEALRMRYEEFV